MPIEAAAFTPPTPLQATTLRLLDPADESELLSLSVRTPTVLNSVDLGTPTYRNVSTSISGAHGESDTSRFLGARAITAEVTLPEGLDADPALDELNAFQNPGRRFWMCVRRPGWVTERRILVRGSGAPCPPGVLRQAQMGFIGPAGLFEDVDVSQVVLSPLGAGSGGFTLPVTFPLTMTSGLVPGASFIDIDGNIETPPVIDIFGPCSNPLVRCVDTGKQIRFALTLAAGDFLRVDLGARTAYLNADPGQSRYQTFDFASSSWWTLPVARGVQVLFTADAPSGVCQAQVNWRSRWM